MNTFSTLTLASEFEAPLGWTSMPAFGSKSPSFDRDVEAVAALVRQGVPMEASRTSEKCFWTHFQQAPGDVLAAPARLVA